MAGRDLLVPAGEDAGRDAHRHGLAPAVPLGRGRHARALVEAVQHEQAAARRERGLDVGVGLAVAVHDDARGVDAGAQGRGELARAGDVGTQPAGAEQPQHAHRAAGLAGERDVRVGVLGDAVDVGPRALAQRGGVVDVERRAEARRELLRAHPSDLERAVAALRRDRPGRAERRHALAQARVAATRQVSAASCSATRSGEVPPGALRAAIASSGVGSAKRSPAAMRDATCSCASRNGMPPRTSASATSVATRGAVGGRLAHALGVEVQARHQQRGRAQRAVVGRHLREGELLVLLQVAVVRQRQALADGEHGREPADRDARAPAQVLGDLRVLLLRHHRRAERDRVVELRERELLRREHDHLLGQAREVHEPERAGVEQVADEVAVGDRVDRVVERAREAELAGRPLRVERQARAGQRAGAERALVGRGVGAARSRSASRSSIHACAARWWPSSTGCARCRCV